ncbi:WW domain-containing protein tag-325 [Condylostylus longicornis]|uniref:WW domain-containing protein tag-325 n=1 Tax=Condylostylus longicornis TaxID=2530218 RepID=UPI00244E3824|nr:WW domain-containing protein tag-325 [Condylostylus longicornis]
MEQYDKLQKKIEILENEAIRHNKQQQKQPQQQYQQYQGLNQEFNDSNDSINMIKTTLLRGNNTSTPPPPPSVTNSPVSGHRLSLSVMPSDKEKKRTLKKLIQLSEVNATQTDGYSGSGFWTKFTQFFKYRPTVESLKEQNIYQNEPCFDTELENVVKHEDYPTIPKIVIECVKLIELKAKKKPTEGLYRMSGNHVEIQKIRFLIDGNDYECLKNIRDIHTIVGVLKLFLREIKDPLVNASEIKLFIGAARDWTLAPIKMKITVLQKLVKSLPEQNRDTLSYLLRHLHKLTRMPLQFVNSRSLAVSLTPTIFHFTVTNNADIHTTMKENEILTSCLEVMIEYDEKIFDFTSQNEFRQSVI